MRRAAHALAIALAIATSAPAAFAQPDPLGRPVRMSDITTPAPGDIRLGDQRIPVNGPGADIAAGDLNGDGTPDIATVSPDSGSITILTNRDGDLSARSDFPLAGRPQAIAAADLDGDGRAELLVALADAQRLVILRLDGGALEQTASLQTGALPAAVTTIHLAPHSSPRSGRGELGLVVANAGDHSIGVYEYLGNGAFTEPVLYASGGQPIDVIAADVTGDGREDIVVANHVDATIGVLPGLPDSRFDDMVASDAGYPPYSIAAGDLDGDGDLDLAVGTESQFVLLTNAGRGQFIEARRIPSREGRAWGVALADLAGDGRVALLGTTSGPWGYQYERELVTVFMDPLDPRDEGQDYAVGVTPARLLVCDLNGDGVLDFATMNTGPRYDPTISIAQGIGDGRFCAIAYYQTEQVPGYREQAALAFGSQPIDLDGDGYEDQITGTTTYPWQGEESTYEIRYGDGTGGFSESREMVMRRFWIAADVDGDGLPDLIHNSERILSRDFLNAVLMYRRNLGGREFAAPESLGIDLFWFDFVMKGVDLDGRPGGELLIVRSHPIGPDSLRVFKNEAPGKYVLDDAAQMEWDNSTGLAWEHAAQLFLCDVNGDGVRDVVVFSTTYGATGYFCVLIGGTDGRFHLTDVQRHGAEPWSIAVGDLNGDGRSDVVLVDFDTNWPGALYVFQGQPDGSTSLVGVFYPGNYPGSAAIADFDGDGLRDLAVSIGNGNLVALFHNCGEPRAPLRVFASVERAEAIDGVIHVDWQLSSPAPIVIERTERGNHWERLDATPQVAGTSVSLRDSSTASPGRLGYRLRSPVPAVVIEGGEAWVNPMRRGGLQIHHAESLQQGSVLALDVSLESAAPLRIELFDVLGRRVMERRVTGAVAGRQRLELGASLPRVNGTYWIRVTAGREAAVSRVLVVR